MGRLNLEAGLHYIEWITIVKCRKFEMRLVQFLIVSGITVSFLGCANPYAYYPNYLTPQSSNEPHSQVVYLKPMVSPEKVTPIQKIIVKKIEPNSPAEKAGLRSGDVVLSINDKNFGTVEKFNEYLPKARWLESTYRIVRHEPGYAHEKEIKVKPEKDFPTNGLNFQFLDNDLKPAYPLIKNGVWIRQVREMYGLGVSMSLEESLLKVDYGIRNNTDSELVFNPNAMLLLDKDKTVLPVLRGQEVLTEKYRDAVSQNPIAALQTLPMLTTGQTVADNIAIRIPPGARIFGLTYVRNQNISFPITLQVKIKNEEFEFKFDKS